MNVIDHFEEEKKRGRLLYSVSKPRERVAAACDIGVRSVDRIKKEMCEGGKHCLYDYI